jgi:hypothetical protein
VILKDKAAEPILRKLESQVLDSSYQHHRFWGHPKPKGLWGVMAAYDAMLPVFMRVGGAPYAVAISQSVKGWQDGFSQAMRWLSQRTGDLSISPSADWNLIADAGDFVRFAQTYVDIADFHMMYGRGLVGLEAEESPQRVRFVPCRESREREWYGLDQSMKGYLKEHRERALESGRRLQEAMPSILGLSHRLENGRIVLDDPKQLACKGIAELGASCLLPEVISLPDETQLHSFTMGEFRQFWHVMVSWSMCVQGLYMSHATNGVLQSECSATQYAELGGLQSAVAELSGLRKELVMQIMELHSLGHGGLRPDILLQPLLLSQAGAAWCPMVVVDSRAERNVLKLLARLPHTRNLAATLIGEREAVLLRQVGTALAARGYQFSLRKQIQCGTEVTEVDLLAYHTSHPAEALLVEGKALLPVNEVNEIDAATGEMRKAQGQVERTSRILQQVPEDIRRRLYPFVAWNRVKHLYPLVVTPDVYPNSSYDYSRVPATTLVAMRNLMRPSDFSSPERLWSAAMKRAWLSRDVSTPSTASMVSYKRVIIRGVIYEMPYEGGTSEDKLAETWF